MRVHGSGRGGTLGAETASRHQHTWLAAQWLDQSRLAAVGSGWHERITGLSELH